MKKIVIIFMLSGIICTGKAYGATSITEELPVFFHEDVQKEWKEKQEKRKRDRRDRLRNIRSQRLERAKRKKLMNEGIYDAQKEKEVAEALFRKQMEEEMKRILEEQKRKKKERANVTKEEIEQNLESLNRMEEELKQKLEENLEKIAKRRTFLKEKLEEIGEIIESEDFVKGVTIQNADEAIDIELEKDMVFPEDNPQKQKPFANMQLKRRIQKHFQKDASKYFKNKKLSSKAKILQMQGLKRKQSTKKYTESINRARKIQRALNSRRR